MKNTLLIYFFIFGSLLLLSSCVPPPPEEPGEIPTGSDISDTGFISVDDTLKKSLPDVVYNPVDDNFFAF